MTKAPAFICPICNLASWNPNDAKNRFCAVCGFVDKAYDPQGRSRVVGPLSLLAKAHFGAWRSRTGFQVPWEDIGEAQQITAMHDLRVALRTLQAEAGALWRVTETGDLEQVGETPEAGEGSA